MGMPTKTSAQQAAISIGLMKDNAIQIEQQLKQVVLRTFSSLWNNPNKFLTPEVQVAELGTDAAAMFNMFEGLATFVKKIDPSFVVPAPTRTYTINSDGTVTLGAAA